MNFTAKEDYGLRAILDLAVHQGTGRIQTREIAERQRIPEQFLEQLLAALRRAEIIRSVRGASGGYALASDPRQITVGQVLRALSGPLVPPELCSDVVGGAESQNGADLSVVRGVWEALESALRQVADTTTLQDLLEKRQELLSDFGYMMHI